MHELERLSAGDCLFLDIESDVNAMYMSACLIFDARPLQISAGDLDWERILELIEDRISRIPRFRQRLDETPIAKRPIWVDAGALDFGYHVRREKLAKGSDRSDLKRRCAEFGTEPLDRKRPLWNVLVIDGFEPDRFALVIKVHHSLADGIAGIQLAGQLLSKEPTPAIQETHHHDSPPRSPHWSELLFYEVREQLSTSIGLTRRVLRAATEPISTVSKALEFSNDLRKILEAQLNPPSDTPLDRPNHPSRSLDWMQTELSQIKAIRTRYGGTVNDVVVTTATLALGRFLESLGVSTRDQRKLDVRVAVPVNMRDHPESAPLGNRISMIFARIPLGERDPLVALDRTRESLATTKDSGSARALGRLLDVAEWTPRVLTRPITRWSMSAHPANLVLTNIRGPDETLYLLGAELLEVYPVVPLMPGQSLAVAVLSYAGRLHWGFHADQGTIRDLTEWTIDAATAFESLYKEATSGPAEATAKHAP